MHSCAMSIKKDMGSTLKDLKAYIEICCSFDLKTLTMGEDLTQQKAVPQL